MQLWRQGQGHVFREGRRQRGEDPGGVYVPEGKAPRHRWQPRYSMEFYQVPDRSRGNSVQTLRTKYESDVDGPRHRRTYKEDGAWRIVKFWGARGRGGVVLSRFGVCHLMGSLILLRGGWNLINDGFVFCDGIVFVTMMQSPRHGTMFYEICVVFLGDSGSQSLPHNAFCRISFPCTSVTKNVCLICNSMGLRKR